MSRLIKHEREVGEKVWVNYCRMLTRIEIEHVIPNSYDEKDTLWDLVCECKIIEAPNQHYINKRMLCRISLMHDTKDTVMVV